MLIGVLILGCLMFFVCILVGYFVNMVVLYFVFLGDVVEFDFVIFYWVFWVWLWGVIVYVWLLFV